MILLITGRPQVGKTTLIKRIGQEFSNFGGFFTEEIREGGKRVGFSIESLDGKKGILAHVDIESPYHIGKYGVDTESLDQIGVQAIEEAVASGKNVLIDEIGRMELYSENFQRAVLLACDQASLVVAAIQLKKDLFADALKARADSEVYRLTVPTRAQVTQEVLERIAGSE